jgi:hypothetical protein
VVSHDLTFSSHQLFVRILNFHFHLLIVISLKVSIPEFPTTSANSFQFWSLSLHLNLRQFCRFIKRRHIDHNKFCCLKF